MSSGFDALGNGLSIPEIIRRQRERAQRRAREQAAANAQLNPNDVAFTQGALDQIGNRIILSVVRLGDNSVQVIVTNWAGQRETLILATNELDDPNAWTTDQLRVADSINEKAFDIWAPAVSGAMGAAYHVDQMRLVHILACVQIRQSPVEIRGCPRLESYQKIAPRDGSVT